MRTRRTRVHRGASPRRRRTTRSRGRATVRHQPPRRRTSTRRTLSTRRNVRPRRRPQPRRGSYRGGARAHGLDLRSFARTPTVAVAAVVLIGAVVAAAVLGTHGFRTPPATSVASQSTAAAQLIYTARTANDSAIALPVVVQNDLHQIGMAHQSIDLTKVDYAGDASTSVMDMTPRTGNSSQDPPIKVNERAGPVIAAKISRIQTDVNAPAGTTGGRALYAGLTKIDFTSAPVTIVSSGLDLANPDNFRNLDWTVTPATVVADVKKAGALPALHGPVTFVLVPTSGSQPQLEQSQKDYLKQVWRTLLTAAGATTVTFIDADSTFAGATAPSAPTVPIPALPNTPIPQVHEGNNTVQCTVPDSYFVFDQADLVDPVQTTENLTSCITAALQADATFALDGWTSYEGPLNADGKPEFDYPYNRTLSDQRVATIAHLLVSNLQVSQADITRTTGHGNVDQPNPDPRSAANRVVVITYTTK